VDTTALRNSLLAYRKPSNCLNTPLAMKFIQGENRHQLCLFPVSIDQSVEEDNEVRFIDLFVDSPDLSSFGFKSDFVENGRPAYHPDFFYISSHLKLA